MTTEQLHEILDDENRELSLQECKEIIYQLKNDVFDAHSKKFPKTDLWKRDFYMGEMNAFYICLDLLEHININEIKEKENENLH